MKKFLILLLCFVLVATVVCFFGCSEESAPDASAEASTESETEPESTQTTKPPEIPSELEVDVYVSSGGKRVEPVEIFQCANFSDATSSWNIDGNAYWVIEGYDEERLSQVPHIKLDGTLELELSQDAYQDNVVIISIVDGKAVVKDVSLEDLYMLESGEYLVGFNVSSRKDIGSATYLEIIFLETK